MAHTKILLREDVDDLGARGEIVRVGQAMRATICCRANSPWKRRPATSNRSSGNAPSC